MKPQIPPDQLTVLYDGACPLCRREIAHAEGLATRRGNTGLCFLDISSEGNGPLPVDRDTLLARFHVQRSDGTLLVGAAAFVAMWSRLPGWRWLARLARLPGMLWLMERAYSGFLRVRPSIQALVRRLDANPGTPPAPTTPPPAPASDAPASPTKRLKS